MLNERKSRILTDIIRTYVRDAEPVGSLLVAERSKLDLSPATVRNEMLELEEQGYLFQPHTSAGRIPTAKGWRYYLDYVLQDRDISKHEQGELKKIVRAYRYSRYELLKHVAQSLADFTETAVFVAFTSRDTYYTGISKLFGQPEFEEIDLVRNISQVVDHLDDVMPKILSRLEGDVTVLIGDDNPFSAACGLVLASVSRQPSVLGVLGPLRQDYDNHVSLVRFTRNLLAQA